MLSSGMAVPVRYNEVPRFRGKPVTAGLFTAPHNKASDRLIVDRRSANALERRLGWAVLPSGAQFAQIRIPADSTVRGSGEDLASFFYLLEGTEKWHHFSTVGRPFFGHEEPELGLDPQGRYFLALRVWAMGAHNSVDFAQATREAVLSNHGALSEAGLVRFGRPLPASFPH